MINENLFEEDVDLDELEEEMDELSIWRVLAELLKKKNKRNTVVKKKVRICMALCWNTGKSGYDWVHEESIRKVIEEKNAVVKRKKIKMSIRIKMFGFALWYLEKLNMNWAYEEIVEKKNKYFLY